VCGLCSCTKAGRRPGTWLALYCIEPKAIAQALRKELTAEMEAAGLPVPHSHERWAAAEKALIGVWASKFNDRAYFSMRKVRCPRG
jgi:alpha-glucan, water dikinase